MTKDEAVEILIDHQSKREGSISIQYSERLRQAIDVSIQALSELSDKDVRIRHLTAKCEALITELDAVNESLTGLIRKNAELENELEYAKIR